MADRLRLRVSLTPAEYEHVEARARSARMTVYDYVRARLDLAPLGARDWSAVEADLGVRPDAEIAAELGVPVAEVVRARRAADRRRQRAARRGP